MKVQDVMTKDFAWCTPQTLLPEVARLMQENDCGAIPILMSQNNHHLAGVVTDRDIVIRAVARDQDPRDMTAEDCMSPSPEAVTPETDLHECCERMERRQVRRLPVVDDNGECCGIVAQADIALHAPEHEIAEVVRCVSEKAGGVRATV